jgi:gliding motility-associated-like protein
MGNGDTLSNTHNPTEKYLTAGDFDITLHTTYPVCPMQTTTHTVHVDDYPKVDLGLPEEICTGSGSVTISDNANPTATYVWSTGANTNSITVTAPGIYQVTVTKGECETKASKLIVPDLDCIFIPNAFSPNGDGRNDYFKPQWYDINDIGTYHMIVYNRFGEQVYSTDDKNDKGWDGTYKNKPCSMDAYMYMINVVSVDGNKKSFKGDVTLVR